ncbi:MAG: hypothetical protein ACRC2S_28055 [Waterburya sp.]
MNTSIHIPEALAQRLNDYLERRNNDSNLSRNAAIVEAIRDWLDRQEPVREWSNEILNWCSQAKSEESEEDIFELAREEQDWGDFSF